MDTNSILNWTLKSFWTTGSGCDMQSLSVIMCTVTNVVNYLQVIAWALMFVMILWAAIVYLTSYGDDSKIETAKKTITWSVVGVVVITLSKVVIHLIANQL